MLSPFGMPILNFTSERAFITAQEDLQTNAGPPFSDSVGMPGPWADYAKMQRMNALSFMDKHT